MASMPLLTKASRLGQMKSLAREHANGGCALSQCLASQCSATPDYSLGLECWPKLVLTPCMAPILSSLHLRFFQLE